MQISGVRDLLQYHYWANRRILSMVEQASAEQFVAPSVYGIGSLRDALVHLIFADWAWRLLLQGNPFPDPLEPADFPTVAALRERWQAEEAAFWAYVDGLTDADLAGIIRYPVEGGIIRERVLWHCLYHLVNHGTQHRSEAAALLTGYGLSPGEIDFTAFLNERGARA